MPPLMPRTPHHGWTGGQFSLVRVIFGVYLFIALTRHALLIEQVTWAGVAAVGAALSVPLILGWHRWSAAGIFAVLTILAAGLPTMPGTDMEPLPSARVLLTIAGLVLLVIALLPPAPYGSWPARGRSDPGGGWRFPRHLFVTMWVIVAGLFLLWGVLLVPDVGWRAAERGMRLGAFGHAFPLAWSLAGNWFLLGAWLAMGPLALTRTTRPMGWLAVLMANAVVLPLAGYGDLALALVMLSLLTFDPAWLPPRTEGGRDTVFYDGHCGLCHRAVRFVLAEDAVDELFELSPQQSEYFQTTIPAAQRQELPDSIVLRKADGTLRVRSAAVVEMLDRLGGWWRVVARLAGIVPRWLRDAAYDAVARVRLALFAQPPDVCPMTPPHLRQRFRM